MSTKDDIRVLLLEAGATAVGFTKAEPVDAQTVSRLNKWISQGYATSTPYMKNYPDIRRDPRLLLDGAKTIICSAWNYLPSQLRDPSLPHIARFAYCADYHKSLRRILKPICKVLTQCYGANARICIDSAPILERYWAQKSGIGFIGRNNCIIIPNVGSWHFLAEIIMDIDLEPDLPLQQSCIGCDKCINACPTKALIPGFGVDTNRCLSALTLEIPGNAPHEYHTLAGCDICQEVCPHNADSIPSKITELETLTQIINLDEETINSLTDIEFKNLFGATSLYRPGLSGLRKNLS